MTGPVPLRGALRPTPFRCPDCGRTWTDPSEIFAHVMAFGPAERAAKADRRKAS